jgi:hypothetical protein
MTESVTLIADRTLINDYIVGDFNTGVPARGRRRQDQSALTINPRLRTFARHRVVRIQECSMNRDPNTLSQRLLDLEKDEPVLYWSMFLAIALAFGCLLAWFLAAWSRMPLGPDVPPHP